MRATLLPQIIFGRLRQIFCGDPRGGRFNVAQDTWPSGRFRRVVGKLGNAAGIAREPGYTLRIIGEHEGAGRFGSRSCKQDRVLRSDRPIGARVSYLAVEKPGKGRTRLA